MLLRDASGDSPRTGPIEVVSLSYVGRASRSLDDCPVGLTCPKRAPLGVVSDDLWTGLADVAPDERIGEGSGGAFVRVFAIAGSEYEFVFAARRLLADEGLSVVAIDEISIVEDVTALAEDDRGTARDVIESGTAGRSDTFHAYPEVDEE